MIFMSESPLSTTESSSIPRKGMPLVHIIFIALMSAANVGIDLLLSPSFIALFSHIIAGVFIMVPINLIFIALTKYLVNDRFGSLTLYMIIFGTIAVPTSFFGANPGVYKIIVGLFIGITLDLFFMLKQKYLRPIIGGIGGSIMWWIMTFTVWNLFNFPYVAGFSVLFNEFWNISNIVTIPIPGISLDMVLFALICGISTSLPAILACFIAYGLFKQIEKTAIYSRFSQM